MLRPYARVARTPGVAVPLLASFLGSLPIGMLDLGVLLLVRSTTGSIAHAGLAVGGLGAGNACGLMIQGWSIDRYGQTVILILTGGLCGGALGLLTIAAVRGWPFGFVVGLAALAGASIPAVNTSLRVILPRLLRSAVDRQAGYALSGTQFQVATINGLLLASGLLLVAGPSAAVLVAAGLATLAGLGFAATPASRGWRPAARPVHRAGRFWSAGLCTLLVGQGGAGLAVGLCSVAIPAAALAYDSISLSGPLFALQSAGGLIGGIAYGGRAWRARPPSRLVICQTVGALGALTLAALALEPRTLLPLMFPVLFATSALQAPGGIVGAALLDDVAPAGALGRAYTSMVAATLGGVALGSALGGVLSGAAGPSAAFGVAGTAMATTAAWTALRRRALTPGALPTPGPETEAVSRNSA